MQEHIRDDLLARLKRKILQLEQLFRRWDADGDGQISRREWRDALQTVGIVANREHIDHLFDFFDAVPCTAAPTLGYPSARASLHRNDVPMLAPA